MNATNPSNPNRRASPRRKPKSGVKVSCQKGSLGLGPNLAVTLLDLSETGARLVLKSPLNKGQEVEINLTVPGVAKPFKQLAVIVWSVPAADGACQVGARFQRALPYRDLMQITVLA